MAIPISMPREAKDGMFPTTRTSMLIDAGLVASERAHGVERDSGPGTDGISERRRDEGRAERRGY
jgi:hypothetical protein